jgi:hypothetical protein
MAPIPRKRSLADMQNADGAVPTEYNDDDYLHEVLRLKEGQTEALFDEQLVREAEKLGITISRPPTADAQNENHNSMCESALTLPSHHARTASSGSQGSVSTGMTSRSSIHEQLDTSTPVHARKRPISRRSLSFAEYEKYLAQHEAQEAMKSGIVPPPMPAEPAPSLFSVSTRRSYVSIKNGIKSKFRLRRSKTNQEDSK